jgi:nitrous oxidase accessory protein NosD
VTFAFFGVITRRNRSFPILLALLIIGSSAIVFSSDVRAGSQVSHAAISITGNSGFTAANGVARGTGTASDPYIISGWILSEISINNTSAYFVVTNVTANGGGNAIVLGNVTNGALENLAAWGSYQEGPGTAIYVSGSRNISISGVQAASGGTPCCGGGPGVWIQSSADMVIANNSILTSVGNGLSIYGAANITVTGNVISRDGDGYGMVVSGSTNVTLSANNFQNSGLVFSGSLNIAPNNLVNGKPLDYFNGCSSGRLSLDNVPVGQLIIQNCSNVQLSNLNVESTDVGILMTNVHNALVSNVNASLNNFKGLELDGSWNVTIEQSDFSFQPEDYFSGPGSNTMINIVGSSGVVIDGVRFDGDYGAPIRSYNSVNLTISGNTFANGVGFICLQGSTGVHIFHNNFYPSTGVVCTSDTQPGHYWDNGYPSGGNYWSNYTGVDNCSGPMQNICPSPDGIGDTPYSISGGIYQDHYPLMKPFVAKVDPPASTGGGGGGQPLRPD